MRHNAAPVVALAALLLVAVPLAGCTDQTGGPDGGVGDGPSPLYASFGEAMAADGMVLAPNGSDSTVRLKMLQPSHQNDTTGESSDQPVVVLLYDSATNEPIPDADFSAEADCTSTATANNDGFCAWMPAMGHGTSPEESLVHVAHGEYHGMTFWLMTGTWQLEFNPQLSNGQVLNFDGTVCVDSCQRS